MLSNRTTVLALVGSLIDEGIEAEVLIGKEGVEVFLRPATSVAKLASVLGEQSLDMVFDGARVFVIDRSGELPEVVAPAEPFTP